MFEKLKQRWGVNGFQLVLVIITFAAGGSTCAAIGKWLLSLTELDKGTVVWLISYVLLVSIIWPVCVLIISIPLGQFSFFKNYLGRVWVKMTGNKQKKS
ncbi:MAG: DUF6787 family protein [Ferruginibacter sp.]